MLTTMGRLCRLYKLLNIRVDIGQNWYRLYAACDSYTISYPALPHHKSQINKSNEDDDRFKKLTEMNGCLKVEVARLKAEVQGLQRELEGSKVAYCRGKPGLYTLDGKTFHSLFCPPRDMIEVLLWNDVVPSFVANTLVKAHAGKNIYCDEGENSTSSTSSSNDTQPTAQLAKKGPPATTSSDRGSSVASLPPAPPTATSSPPFQMNAEREPAPAAAPPPQTLVQEGEKLAVTSAAFAGYH